MLITPTYWGSSGISSLSYITATTSNHTTTVTHPASGINAGDLLIFIEAAGDNASPVPPAGSPSGYTIMGWQNVASTDYGRCIAYYKIAVGNEDGTSINGMTETNEQKHILQFRANKPITSLSYSSIVGEGINGNPSVKTILASQGTPPVLGLTEYFICYGGTISPRTCNVTPTVEVSAANSCYVQAFVQNSSPQDYTFDMDDEGGVQMLFGLYVHNFK